MIKLHYEWNISGHEKQLAALENDLRNNNLSHAYLFTGPAHIGKYTVIKRFAKALQCENDLCDVCEICLQIDKGYHPDTLEILDQQESIKIETVRETLMRLYLTKHGRYKILLVKNIDRMTTEAANALLKMLEEPPAGVVFLLTTSNFNAVLPTIISRVRSCRFQKSSKNEQASTAYQALFTQIENLVEKADMAERFVYVAGITEDASLVKDFLEVFLIFMRKKLFDSLHSANTEEMAQIISKIKFVDKINFGLARNVNNRLLLENLMLTI